MSVVEDHIAVPITGGEPAGRRRPDEREASLITRLADDVIPVLIERLSTSTLGELEVRQDGWRVRLRRGRVNSGASSIAPTTPERSSERPPEQPRQHVRPRPANGGAVTSPAVGYYQPREDVAKGARLRGGDLLGHVDVLGVLHDVVVPEDGRLVELLAAAGEAVEYGQPLARLEPESRS